MLFKGTTIIGSYIEITVSMKSFFITHIKYYTLAILFTCHFESTEQARLSAQIPQISCHV